MLRWLFEHTPAWACWVGFVIGPPLFIAGVVLRKRFAGRLLVVLGLSAVVMTAFAWLIVLVGIVCTGRNGDWIC